MKRPLRIPALLLALGLCLALSAHAAEPVQKSYIENRERMYVYLVGGEEFAVSAADKIEFEQNNPEAVPLMEEPDASEPVEACFRHIAVTESLLSAVRDAGRAAEITLDHCTYAGAAEETLKSGGLLSERLESPLTLTLLNGSVWTVTKESHLSGLTLDRSSRIDGASMTVDGVETEIALGVYEGEIVLTPADKTLSAVEIDGEAYVTLDDLLDAMGK